MEEATRTRIGELTWYHTLELGDSVVTEGMFDHRTVLGRLGLPDRLTGTRCLDVGTMDGYFAFEMERRGCSDVHAIDVEAADALDWPRALRDKSDNTYDRQKRERFDLAHTLLASGVQRHLLSVYDLGRSLGSFDLIFCGDLLVHLRDPIAALENLRAACDGQLVLYTPVLRTPRWRRRPVVEFDGIDQFQWWLPSLAALERMVRAAGFTVERSATIELPIVNGGRAWRGLRGVVTAAPA